MASDKKISKIYNGYPLLKVGMSKAEVITLLGEPDSEMFKYKYPDDKKIDSSSFGYYLKRTEKELATEQDKVIFVYFNIKGELFWVHSENLGLNDLGGPSSE